jgi:putative hydrolase of the HAD superfamily
LVKKFEAVLFDLGGTIIKAAEPSEVQRRILQKLSINVSADDVARAEMAMQAEFDYREMIALGSEYWLKYDMRLLEKLGIEKDKENLARKMDALWWEHADLQAYPDAIETLTLLRKRKIKAGLITNAMSKDYEQILNKLNLTNYFHTIVGIDDSKAAKPDSKIFLYAANKLHVKPDKAIYIGDLIEIDYEGAQNAGLKPLLINRRKQPLHDIETITNLTQVLQFF